MSIDVGIPIIVGGHPKSGTTLLAALLDQHPDIVVFPEETFALNHWRKVPQQSAEYWASYLKQGRAFANLSQGSRETDLDGNFDYSTFDFAAFNDEFDERRRTATDLAAVLTAAIGAYAEQSGGKRRYWLEKSPGNEFSMARARQSFGTMRALYVIRDPRDVFASYASKKARESNGQRALSAATFACRWGLSVATWQQFQQQTGAGLLVRYEDLVRSPQQSLQTICDALSIDFVETSLTPTKRGVVWHGNSMHGDRFAAVGTSPIGRWRENVSDDDRQHIEQMLGKTMRNHGYAVEGELGNSAELIGRVIQQPEQRKRTIAMLLALHGPAPIASRILQRFWA